MRRRLNERQNEVGERSDANAVGECAISPCVGRSENVVASFLNELFGDPLPKTYPNLLASPTPLRPVLRFRPGLLFVLFLLCLIPRAAMCLRIGAICPDGVLYIRLASALERGDYAGGFDVMHLNIYPLTLMALHKLGIDYETAGMALGVLASSLVTLPLFGWIRRQFDDRLAVVACFLYALHPVFIAWSPELIRDSSFWLFFTAFLYSHWRATTELRMRHFLLSGIFLCLAVLTRFEGLFLLIPFVLWSFFRLQTLESRKDRRRVILGSLAIILTPPAIIAVVNLTWLRGRSSWMISRLSPLELVETWWRGLRHGSIGGLPFNRMVLIFIPSLVKGISALFGILMLAGLWMYRKIWTRRDNQTLFMVSLTVLAAAWIHAWNAKESCDRYYVTIVLMASPYAAAALIAFVRKINWIASWSNCPVACRRVLVTTPLLVICAAGLTIAMKNDCEARAAQRDLAAWISDQFGPQPSICGSEGVASVVGFYAGKRYVAFERGFDDGAKLNLIQERRPDVILLQVTRHKQKIVSDSLLNGILAQGYKQIESDRLPDDLDDELLVLAAKTGDKSTSAQALPAKR